MNETYGRRPADDGYFAAPVPQGYGAPAYGHAGHPPGAYAPGAYASGAMASGAMAAWQGPVGKVRGTGAVIALYMVTLGIYGLVWHYKVHAELKRHTGFGLGGGVALLLTFFVGFVMPFLTSSEVGGLYERAGRPKPVSGATGLWVVPGFLLLVLPFVWIVKTNGALNDYWRSVGGY